MVCGGYMDALSRKSRAMVRQSRRRYTFREFAINVHAADVEAVNHSKAQTTYGPVYGWLAGPVFPLPDAFAGLCGVHQDRWFGGFDTSDVLRGYVRLIRMGTLGVIHSTFRHAENSTGVLNGVLADIAERGDVEHVSYHTMDAGERTGRPAFKRHVGFRETQVTFRP